LEKGCTGQESISSVFTVEVKNRFELLHEEINQDNINESYTTLSKLTQEVAEELLPKKAKSSKHQPSNTAGVEQAREKLKLISADYHRSPSVLKKVSLELAKKALDEAYLQTEADFINGKISNIASLHISKQHHAAWTTISEISGKRSKSSVRLKAGSQSERLI